MEVHGAYGSYRKRVLWEMQGERRDVRSREQKGTFDIRLFTTWSQLCHLRHAVKGHVWTCIWCVPGQSGRSGIQADCSLVQGRLPDLEHGLQAVRQDVWTARSGQFSIKNETPALPWALKVVRSGGAGCLCLVARKRRRRVKARRQGA